MVRALSVFFVAWVMWVSPISAADPPAVAAWNFEGSLADQAGHWNDAYQQSPEFVPGHHGQGLRCRNVATIVHDDPSLRPAPGLEVDCWVKFDALGASWEQVLIKEQAYQLRVDPPQDGRRFAFFLNLDGWEPRVQASGTVQIGVWYHVRAGWDGKEIWIDVDGQRTSVRRSGTVRPSGEPLEFGRFAGVLDELRIANPHAAAVGVADWRFQGNLQDSSGHQHPLAGPEARFVAVPGGQALVSTRAVQAADHPELQLAPGFRIDCAVYFENVPPEGRMIAVKNGEYQLRLNSAKEGGGIAFFVHLGSWEPRITCSQRVEPRRWYRVTAGWDGFAIALDVNGKRNTQHRSGVATPTANPLVIGGLGGWIRNVRMENPRRPLLQVADARQEHAILVAGRAEKLRTTVHNLGMPAAQVTLRFRLPPGVQGLGPATHALGPMATGAEKTIDWGLIADAAANRNLEIDVAAAGAAPQVLRRPLVIFPSEEGPPPSASLHLPADPAGDPSATTYYVDALAGDNARDGTSPATAWKDFTNVNGRVLGPGERLLLRRGSVFRQELQVSARGTAERWAEIGAYGEGPRPMLRRNWDIDDRCALVHNPDYLRIRSLVVCYAAKGLIVRYSEPQHRGLVIEDCIAHHVEGLYRFNAHGIPEWRDRRGPQDDGLAHSEGIGVVGHATDVVLRDCDTSHCSSGYYVCGNDVLVERVFCHDNYVHNTSPHPFVVDIRRSIVRNCIFDASGWHASAGTMGVMLGDPQGLIFRDCYFLNQPDSGSADEGGVDFENRGNGCLLDRCTFQNNAGAAIEVLGLRSPQTTNIEIRNSRFIENNHAKKLGTSEIYVWGQAHDPAICCSTGDVRGNGYVLLPGVEFFINEAPRLTDWKLSDNRQYASRAEIERGMPYGRPPQVDAGPDVRTDRRTVALAGRVVDNGPPSGQTSRPGPTATWEVLEGPGRVALADPHDPATAATFDQPGDYLLRLVGRNADFWRSSTVTVHILPAGTAVAAAWEFNRDLDQEGWTEVHPGTQSRVFVDQDWPTRSDPVKLVGGGYYILALEDSPDAHLLSADHLGIALAGKQQFVLRFQNHTPATQMRVRFLTEADGTWDDAKSRTFSVVANDSENRTYTVNLAAAPGWQGRLRRLRIDLATGKPLTGTCRIDYMWIVSPGPRQ